MSNYIATINLTANGNIYPSSFVKVDPSNPYFALQAGVGDQPFGIATDGTETAPGLAGSTGYAASQGNYVKVFPAGARCLLKAGTNGWTTGALLKPGDASGNGVVAADGEVAYAMALDTASVGELSEVVVLPGLAKPNFQLVDTTSMASASYAATAADSGKIFYPGAVSLTLTLPTAKTGLVYTLQSTAASIASGTGPVLAPATGDTIFGDAQATPGANKKATNTQGTAKAGDFIRVAGVTGVGWYVIGVQGTWAFA